MPFFKNQFLKKGRVDSFSKHFLICLRQQKHKIHIYQQKKGIKAINLSLKSSGELGSYEILSALIV